MVENLNSVLFLAKHFNLQEKNALPTVLKEEYSDILIKEFDYPKIFLT